MCLLTKSSLYGKIIIGDVNEIDQWQKGFNNRGHQMVLVLQWPLSLQKEGGHSDYGS